MDYPKSKCQCGCGKLVTIATRSRPQRGIVKGQPVKFFKNHHTKKYDGPYRTVPGPLNTPCWIWNIVSGSGYGVVQIRRGVSKKAHLYNYENKYGPVPEGKELDHLCRIRACGNPDHVEPVTHAENIRRSSTAKINHEIAQEIRSLYIKGKVTLKSISARFGLSISSIYDVVAGKTWVRP